MENFEEFNCGALQFVFWGGFFKGFSTAFGIMAIYFIYDYFKKKDLKEKEREKNRREYIEREDKNYK